ncbi:MAG: 1-acyl-sn-glycerol-3-phosphate acyltransferase [Bacteroidales bacterium]
MKSRIAKFILRVLGWKVESLMSEDIKKAVVVMAPHTSYYDFIFGWLAFAAYRIKGKFMIKKEVFFFPVGPILKAMGGIPVDRSNSKKALKSVKKAFENSKSLFLVVTPEGTRRFVKNWKKGFYFIAQDADVPILLGYLDYKKKVGGIGPLINPHDDFDKILKQVQDFYRDKNARHPEKFSLSEQKD